MKTTIRLAVAGLLLLPALAAAGGFNLSARASTLGVGYEIGYAVNDYVNFRVAFNDYSYEYDTTEDDIDYTFDLELESTAYFLDIHPFGGSFRLTGGLLDNKNRLDGQAEPAGTYEINGVSYSGDQVGTLFSAVRLGEEQPVYVGLGFSQPLGESGWGLGFDIGAVMMGDSDVELAATGPITTLDPNFAANLEAEEQEVESEINADFDTYPVVALGITFQF
ncbi:MAG TPA: hypothetical protein VF254_05050 [Gammaproteobacteria bacterium]